MVPIYALFGCTLCHLCYNDYAHPTLLSAIHTKALPNFFFHFHALLKHITINKYCYLNTHLNIIPKNWVAAKN